jgi:hypothetical protein
MFGLFTKKPDQQYALRIRRLIDHTSAWRMPETETRKSDRCKRTLPIFYAAWCGAPISNQEVKAGVCVDLSENGMRLILLEPPRSPKFLVSIATVVNHDLELFSFVVEKRHAIAMAPGIYSVGMSIVKCVEAEKLGDGYNQGLERLVAGSEMLQQQFCKKT